MHKLGERLQEISNSASKEFSLEKAMAKMKGEWEHVSDGGDDGYDGGVGCDVHDDDDGGDGGGDDDDDCDSDIVLL